MLLQRRNIARSAFLAIICSVCLNNSLQAQEMNPGKKKHLPIGNIVTSFQVADYPVSKQLSGPLKDSLDQTVSYLSNAVKIPGITVSILIPGEGLWQATKGFLSKPAQATADSTSIFYWASVGKLVTATIIDQLVQEHKLSYKDKLAQWFPQFDHARQITIEQLLNHTSGLASFNTDTTLFSKEKHYSPTDLIAIALQQKNLFLPGAGWSYSNTGYLLLALIIEKIDNHSYAESVQQRIAVPLHLSSLRALTQASLSENLALAHDNNDHLVNEDFSVPLGSGNIVANSKDMVLLLYALMSGKIVPAPVVSDRLHDLFPMYERGMYYGRGMMLTDFAEITGSEDLWIGHTGGTESYRALLIYDTQTKALLAISVNAHISVEAIARKLLGWIK
jgi:D-alanyl-D-alanine carboxypeptidase